MHPELLNNSLFLRYYKQWQNDPASIVFAPIAEYFLTYGLLNEAMKICRDGLKRHPMLVSGRMVMAKIHLARGNWEEAEEELQIIFSSVPKNKSALELMEKVNSSRLSEYSNTKTSITGITSANLPATDMHHEEHGSTNPSWNTITMANIYISQGHFSQAKAIYESLLGADPDNEAARNGLKALPVSVEA